MKEPAEKEDVFRISKDRARARDLLEMAKERIEIIDLLPKDKIFKLIEEYYEIIKELLTAVMYSDGYKTLSHIMLIEYFSSNYNELTREEIKLIDVLRKFRNGIMYYGEKVSETFLVNNEVDIKKIIKKLLRLVESKAGANSF